MTKPLSCPACGSERVGTFEISTATLWLSPTEEGTDYAAYNWTGEEERHKNGTVVWFDGHPVLICENRHFFTPEDGELDSYDVYEQAGEAMAIGLV